MRLEIRGGGWLLIGLREGSIDVEEFDKMVWRYASSGGMRQLCIVICGDGNYLNTRVSIGTFNILFSRRKFFEMKEWNTNINVSVNFIITVLFRLGETNSIETL